MLYAGNGDVPHFDKKKAYRFYTIGFFVIEQLQGIVLTFLLM
jgi:hypothetical protein